MAEKIEDEVVEHINPRDDVDGDVRAAIASLKGDAPAELEAPPEPEVKEPEAEAAPVEAAPVKPDHPTDPLRYADGTFKATKQEAPDKVAAPAKPEITPPSDNTKASAAQPSTAVGAPPVSWAADAKQAWASLPPAIQTAVLKREDEASRGFAQYSEKVRGYEQALAPVAQEAQRRGMDVQQGIQRLLDGNRFIETQPVQAIMWLAQKNGLDLAELASNPPAVQRQQVEQVPPHDPRVSQLEERVNTWFMHQNMTAAEAFAADPKNAHYAQVEEQLPGIMSQLKAVDPSLSGVALLQRAYEQAIWLNPEVRAQIIASQQQQQAQSSVQKVAAKAAQASKAAVSVRGSSDTARAAPKPNGTAGNDVYDDVRQSINQLRNA